MAYRYSGTAWDGQKWEAAQPIIALGTQVAAIPNRPTTADGIVASKRHDQVSPNSDHTPKPRTGLGTVRALDVTVSTSQGGIISEAIRASRDKRLKYLIYKDEMFASYSNSKGPAWAWREYTGGGHLEHIHVSTLKAYDRNSFEWDIGFEGGNNLMYTKCLSEAQWRSLYQAGVVKGSSEQAVVDYWVNNAASRTDAEHCSASAAIVTDVALLPGVPGSEGPQGLRGPDGLQGSRGVEGLEGPKGDDGPPGEDGADAQLTIVGTKVI